MTARCENTVRTARRSGRAFTLVELLIVILIIVVLVSILAPAVMTAIKLGHVAKAETRVKEFDGAAECFKMAKKYYPGQRDTDKLNLYSGSQVLAAQLFEYGFASINGNPALSHKYLRPMMVKNKQGVIDHRKSGLFDPSKINPNYCHDSRPNTPSDFFGVGPMAILYFPARETGAGLAQYVEADNSPYLVNNGKPDDSFDGWLGGSFGAFIRDKRLGGNQPCHSGRFLLLGAGMDRKYGTKDDVKNNW